MEKNLIGENIARYRKELNLTQEDLAKAVGVSTQAVSKWECGGTPDAMLLPSIAEKLKVTIDALYGRQRGEGIDLMRLLEQEVCQVPEDKRLDMVCSICWQLMKSVCCNSHVFGKPMMQVLRGMKRVDRTQMCDNEYSASIIVLQDESGIMQSSMAKDYSYFLVMPEPEGGYASIVRDEKSFVEFFQLIGKKNVFKVLAFINTCMAYTFTADYVAHETGLQQKETEEILDELNDRRFVKGREASTSGGIIKIYQLETNQAIIPFLYFASQFMTSWNEGVYMVNDRETKFLKTNVGNGNPLSQWIAKAPDGCDDSGNITF